MDHASLYSVEMITMLSSNTLGETSRVVPNVWEGAACRSSVVPVVLAWFRR